MGDSSPNDDFYLALQMQDDLNNEAVSKESFMDVPKGKSKIRSEDSNKKINNDLENQNTPIIDPNLEYTDPTPDVHKLFVMFSKRFFWDKLGSVIVRWSKRMTECAGICQYWQLNGQCTIALSAPLLMLRPRKDLVETLLHEMIHAYLFVTMNNRDRDAHGPEFKNHMCRINQLAGTNITIYHNFHDEVALYKTHWWRCNGSCQHLKPFFGYVKRSMNRAPGPNDLWWKRHQETCNGEFIKVKEPENYKSKKTQRKGGTSLAGTSRVDDYFPKTTGGSSGNYNKVKQPGTSNTRRSNDLNQPGTSASVPFVPFSGTGHVLGTRDPVSSNTSIHITELGSKRRLKLDQIDDSPSKIPAIEPPAEKKNIENNSSSSRSIEECSSTNSVDRAFCPVCETSVLLSEMNYHLDSCLTSADSQEDGNNPTCLMCQVKLQSTDMSICKCCNASLESHPIHCPVCDKEMKPTDLDRHLEICFSEFFSDFFGNGIDGSNGKDNSS